MLLGLAGGQARPCAPVPPPALSRSPGKPKGTGRLCCWARGALLGSLPLALGSPARSTLLLSRGSFLAMLELPSSHAGQPWGAPPGQRCGRAVALSSQPCEGHWRCKGQGTVGARQLTQPFFLPAARLPSPQALLARLLVSSGALGKELLWPGWWESPGQRCGRGQCREPRRRRQHARACPSPSGIALLSRGWQQPGCRHRLPAAGRVALSILPPSLPPGRSCGSGATLLSCPCLGGGGGS